MRSYEKRSVIEIDNGIVTFFSMTPDKVKLRAFREEQLGSVDEIYHEAKALITTESDFVNGEVMYRSYFLAENRLREADNDTLSRSTVGYTTKPAKSDSNNKPMHQLYPLTDGDLAKLEKIERDNDIENYLSDQWNSTPCRVKMPKKKTLCFIPLGKSYHHIIPATYGKMAALNITDRAYLEQLLRNGRIKLFLERAKELGLNPNEILDLYKFEKTGVIHLSKIQEAEKQIEIAKRGFYNDDTLDESARQSALTQPFTSGIIIKQAKADTPIIEEVKRRALKR